MTIYRSDPRTCSYVNDPADEVEDGMWLDLTLRQLDHGLFREARASYNKCLTTKRTTGEFNRVAYKRKLTAGLLRHRVNGVTAIENNPYDDAIRILEFIEGYAEDGVKPLIKNAITSIRSYKIIAEKCDFGDISIPERNDERRKIEALIKEIENWGGNKTIYL